MYQANLPHFNKSALIYDPYSRGEVATSLGITKNRPDLVIINARIIDKPNKQQGRWYITVETAIDNNVIRLTTFFDDQFDDIVTLLIEDGKYNASVKEWKLQKLDDVMELLDPGTQIIVDVKVPDNYTISDKSEVGPIDRIQIPVNNVQ